MPRVGYKMMMRHRARSMSANPTSLSSLHAFCVAISAAFIGGALAYMYARRKPARRKPSIISRGSDVDPPYSTLRITYTRWARVIHCSMWLGLQHEPTIMWRDGDERMTWSSRCGTTTSRHLRAAWSMVHGECMGSYQGVVICGLRCLSGVGVLDLRALFAVCFV